MRNKKIVLLVLLSMFLVCLIPKDAIIANFAGNEEEWIQKCSFAQDSAEGQKQCQAFSEYLASKKDSLAGEVDALQKDVEALKKDISKAKDVMQDLESKIKDVDSKIMLNEATIATYEKEIIALDQAIIEKQQAIDQRFEYIQTRMMEEQASLGTNIELEIIMGANDIVDMLRKIDGISRITETDRKEIEMLKEEQASLELAKAEQKRLKDQAVEVRSQNVANKQQLERLKTQQKNLIQTYQKQEANLLEKMRSIRVNIDMLKDNMIKVDNPIVKDPLPQNSGFHRPVANAIYSAGTWHYPGGGTHLGLDFAGPVGSAVCAPASGIVLYAQNSVPSNGGFIGNYVGYPAGGGNTLHMIAQVNGTTYAFSFFHLSQTIYAPAGSKVNAGQVIALSGNSGNSSGPHTHIEVINLGHMSLETAVAQFNSSADFAWGLGWGDGALSRTCNITGPPCRMRPEEIF